MRPGSGHSRRAFLFLESHHPKARLFTTLSINTLVTGGVTAAQVTGNGTAVVVVTASQTAINTTLAALDGLKYRGTLNFNGSDTLTVTANDQGNTGSGGSQSDSKTVSVTVTAVNDGPVLTVPGAQTVAEDTNLTIVGISVSDVDAGSNPIQMTFNVGNGTLTLSTGVSGGIVAGNITGQRHQ
jgi:VCBS repeat-containing protein